jgi:hypothetical protein
MVRLATPDAAQDKQFCLYLLTVTISSAMRVLAVPSP